MQSEAPVVQARTPWRIQMAVIKALLLREVKSQFGRKRLGMLMVLLEPVLHMTLLILIRGYLRGRAEHIPDFPVLMLIGLMPFLLFKNISLRTMEGFKADRGLLVYRQVQPMDLFIARAIIFTIFNLVTFILMLLGLGWLGFYVIPVDPLRVMALLLVMIPFGLGFGLVFNVIRRGFPEVKLIIRISFMPLFFLSGVMHPLYVVPSDIAYWLLWNPLLHVAELMRSSFLVNYPMPYPVRFSYIVFAMMLALLVGLRAYRIRSKHAGGV